MALLERDGNVDRGKKSERNVSWIPKVMRKKVCSSFVEDSSNEGKCQCGGSRDVHNSKAFEDAFAAAMASQWDPSTHTSEYPTDAFGELRIIGGSCRHIPFVRLSSETPSQYIYSLLTVAWKLPIPNLVISLVGGTGEEMIKSWVREVVRQGLVRSALATGAWIITNGLKEGVGRCIGEAVKDHGAAATSRSKVVVLGVAPWGLVKNNQELVNAEGSFPARYRPQNTPQDSCYLDGNYQGFLLVDNGTTGIRGGEAGLLINLEHCISKQRTGISGIEIPVLCVLISGDVSVLKRMDESLKKSTPWLVLNDSGSAADMIAELLNELSLCAIAEEGEGKESSLPEFKERAKEIIKKHFPNKKNLEKLVEQAVSIYQNKALITVFDGQQEGSDDFDTVILKALVGASKHSCSNDSEYTDELNLAVAWNKVDFAKSYLFNGGIQWQYDNLKSSMTDALVNNKPQFVRLFIENGLNIADYLTYGHLEYLYQSMSNGTVPHALLHKCLKERLSLPPSPPQSPDSTDGAKTPLKVLPEISMFEVSRLLGELFGSTCQPLYYKDLKIGPASTSRKSAKQFNKLLQREASYHKMPCAFPWSSLFIWAILQNRSEMAIYFWEMAGESVMSALSACKILKELSKLEIETENQVSMRELAVKFENMAREMFSVCYQSDENRSHTLLIRTSPFWGGATCLQMATAADARMFFSHDGVQTLLAQIWWGDMNSRTDVWKLVMSFFLPPLIYTDLITFRDHQHSHTAGLDTSDITAFSMMDLNQTIDEDSKYDDHTQAGHTENPDPTNGAAGRTSITFNEIPQEEEALGENAKFTGEPKRKPESRNHPYIVHRWRQFWFAPVTSFLGNVLMYFLFLFLFAYVLLVEFKPRPYGPTPLEYFLYFWVFTLFCEEIRQTFVVGSSFCQSLKLYIGDMWNKCDLVAILLFVLGLVCRMFEWSYEFGRSMLCVDYMVFTLRLIHIFAVNKHLGPKIIIVGKMVKDVFFFLFFLGVWLLAYGVANQALIYAYDPRPYWVIRRVFYRPYLHIFGQIPLDEIDAHRRVEKVCTNNVTLIQQGDEPCPQSEANWLVLILLSVYLLVTNVLLLNLLIAMFSYTFSKVQEHSDLHWKFQRYNLIVEYHSRPCLAPPFIILSHIRLFFKRAIRKVPSVKIKHFMLDLGTKAWRLETWEAVQKENMLLSQNRKIRESDTERIKRSSAKLDKVLKHVAEFRDHDRKLKSLELEVENCSNSLLWIMEALAESDMIKKTRPPPLNRDEVRGPSTSTN